MGTYVLIDDSDPTILYVGPWAPSIAPHENLTNVGNSGAPMFDTLHMLPSSNGTISLNFTGTGVAVFISIFGEPLNYTSECFVDGEMLPTVPDTRYPAGSNIQLCSISTLQDQEHELFVDISVPEDANWSDMTDSTGFFFDYVLVEPSPTSDINLRNKLLTFDGSPCGNQGSINSVSLGDMGASNSWVASNDGSEIKCRLTFTGIAAIWIGFYDPSMPRTPAQSSYQIDDGTIVPFNTTPTTRWFVGPEYIFSGLTHQTLFRTPSLPIGPHKIDIVSSGDNTTTPLTLQQVVVQVSVVSQPQPATTTIVADPVIAGPPPSSSNALLPNPPRRVNTKEIVGCTAGAMIFLLVFSGLGVLLLRRKQLRRHGDPHSAENQITAPFPQMLGREQMTIDPRKLRLSQQGIANPLTQSLQDPPVTKWTRQAAELSGNSIRPLSGPAVSTIAITMSETSASEHASRISLFANPTSEEVRAETQSQSLPPPHTHTDTCTILSALSSAYHVHEEDSGIRLVHQNNGDTIASLFPPVYTAH